MSETIKVVTNLFDGGFIVINKADFDPAVMVEFGVEPVHEELAPAEPVSKPSKKTK